MGDSFDPSIPFAHFPLEEVQAMFNDEDFGKIRVLDEKSDKKKEKK